MNNSWGKPYSSRLKTKGVFLNTILFKGQSGWVWRIMRGMEMLGSGRASRQIDARRQMREMKARVKGKA